MTPFQEHRYLARSRQGHSLEALKSMKDSIERLRRLGVEAIDE
jgi:hypothetical protein